MSHTHVCMNTGSSADTIDRLLPSQSKFRRFALRTVLYRRAFLAHDPPPPAVPDSIQLSSANSQPIPEVVPSRRQALPPSAIAPCPPTASDSHGANSIQLCERSGPQAGGMVLSAALWRPSQSSLVLPPRLRRALQPLRARCVVWPSVLGGSPCCRGPHPGSCFPGMMSRIPQLPIQTWLAGRRGREGGVSNTELTPEKGGGGNFASADSCFPG